MVITRYVIDSWGWIEYLSQSIHGEKVKLIIDDEKNEIFINSIIIAEVISKATREKRDANIAFKALSTIGRIADINDSEFSKEVGIIHAKTREKIKDFGLADAFIL
ncbi:MAG: PIN domain-containing protein, partial [Nanoarchaeota archaeon]